MEVCRNRNIKELVWAPNRDEVFLQWFAEDVALLSDAGFSKDETLKMLSTLLYVRVWRGNPPWLFPIKGLPKGHHWKNGQKFSQKGGKGGAGYSYTLLPIGDDLYIKGTGFIGTSVDDFLGVKIKGYKNLTYTEVLGWFPEDYAFCSAIDTFWHMSGLRMGFRVPCLRDWPGMGDVDEEGEPGHRKVPSCPED